MIAFIAWYLILTLLGWLTFPLTYRLFPALSDRGFTLSRTAGLLLWSYVFWLFTALGLSFNNLGGILFGLLPVIGLSALALFARRGGAAGPSQGSSSVSEILQWIRDNLRVVVTAEILFLVAFGLLALLRAGNPTLDNAEKPMELMFINSILRSPSFPPHDGWLSGYAISYYYFGYVMTAMLAQVSGVSGSIAHNLMTSLVFSLTAVGAYGILFNLLATRRSDTAAGSVVSALLAPLFMLVVSNLEGFLEVLHRRGLLWGGTRNFWTWLDIKDLNQAPALPLGWIPDRFWWWWRASRVISDYDLAGAPREVIDEFPFFTFLHADLHPHVLAVPLLLLTVAVGLNIFRGGWTGEFKILGARLHLSRAGFLIGALVLGGMAFLNIWDILLCGALIAVSYGLQRVRSHGWSWDRLLEMLVFAVPLAAAAVLLYLPFYFGFSSQAGGLLPNLVSPTRGAQLWVMFAPLLLPLLSYMAYLALAERKAARWGTALLLALGLIVALLLFLVLAAWVVAARDPGAAQGFLAAQGVTGLSSLIGPAVLRRLSFSGGLLTMLAVLVPALAFLLAMRTETAAPEDSVQPKASKGNKGRALVPVAADETSEPFVFFLIALASLLLIGPEFVYLRDQFGYRLNTIFKFYFQAWLLWSVPAGFAVVVLLRRLRGVVGWVFSVGLVILLMAAFTYPALAIGNKTNNFKPYLGWTLDDFRRIERANPDEAAAIQWLRAAPDGVVAEAVGGSYSEYGRISVYTGLPSVLGWPGHEVQWRGTSEPQGSRQDDIKVLYETADWEQARPILEKYGVRYVVIGDLERSTYAVQEDKFAAHLNPVFQQGAVHVYEVP